MISKLLSMDTGYLGLPLSLCLICLSYYIMTNPFPAALAAMIRYIQQRRWDMVTNLVLIEVIAMGALGIDLFMGACQQMEQAEKAYHIRP